MKTVRVDFSTTVRGGLVRANTARASEPLEVGDEVLAYDPSEDMEYEATVQVLEGRFAYLAMHWAGIAKGPNLIVTFRDGVSARECGSTSASGSVMSAAATRDAHTIAVLCT